MMFNLKKFEDSVKENPLFIPPFLTALGTIFWWLFSIKTKAKDAFTSFFANSVEKKIILVIDHQKLIAFLYYFPNNMQRKNKKLYNSVVDDDDDEANLFPICINNLTIFSYLISKIIEIKEKTYSSECTQC